MMRYARDRTDLRRWSLRSAQRWVSGHIAPSSRDYRLTKATRFSSAINRAFGELVARPYEAPRAQLVHYIQPATDLVSVRGGHESERLHTDTADWEPPVELISMVCVRADPAGGGHSRVLDVDTIRDEVDQQLGAATLERLQTEPVPWQLADYCGGGVQWRTILTDSSVCWRRYTIDMALDSTGATLSPEMLRALEDFENVISRTPRTIDFLMREGELLFSDNRRTIHARTPTSARHKLRPFDDSQLDTKRLKMELSGLLGTWIIQTPTRIASLS